MKILPGCILDNCNRGYPLSNIIFALFLPFSKKYKVMLLLICVFIFYICSISNLFFILFHTKSPFELYLRYFILFSTLCHGEWKLLLGF